VSVIIDAGPMVALHNRSEEEHALCVALLSKLKNDPVVTTWPALTEAMYLLGQRGRWRAQSPLWQMITQGMIGIDRVFSAGLLRIEELMATYENVPMDLADASIIELAERTPGCRVFTIDSDFEVYRMRNKRPVPLVR
jgi:predicted nucleic acid-binding protein